MAKLLAGGFSTKITRVCQELRVLVYPSAIDLSSRSLRFPTGRLKAMRQEIGTLGGASPASRQALLALAHLRCDDSCVQLAAGFGVGIATVYHYIREAVEALAGLAPSLAEAMRTMREKAFVILDGTLLPIDRIPADPPTKRHGRNAQVLTDPSGRLLWALPTLPGSSHDLTAARQHGIIEALTEAGLKCRADKAHQGVGGPVRAVPRPAPQAVAAPPDQHPRQDPPPRRAGPLPP